MKPHNPLRVVRFLVEGPFAGDHIALPVDQRVIYVREPEPGALVLGVFCEGRELGRYVHVSRSEFRWMPRE